MESNPEIAVAVVGVFVAVIAIVVAGYIPRMRTRKDRVTESQETFKNERKSLNNGRIRLGKTAADLHLDADRSLVRVGSSDFMTRPEYLLDRPVPLTSVLLDLAGSEGGNHPEVGRAARRQLPLQSPRERFATYSEALGHVCPPQLYDDRLSYRMLSIGHQGESFALRFSTCRYFEMIDTAQALAHELHTAAQKHAWRQQPLRAMLRHNVFSLTERVVLPSVATLTVVRRSDGSAYFLMHWRDPAKVSITANQRQVIPAGVFQPASMNAVAVRRDLDLWRNVMREMGEELLDLADAHGDSGDAVDYDHDEPYASLDRARREGSLSIWCFGLGVDPLTLTVEFLTAAVFDEEVFKEIFPEVVASNREGVVIRHEAFTESNLVTYLALDDLAPSATACLELAWQHRVQMGLPSEQQY